MPLSKDAACEWWVAYAFVLKTFLVLHSANAVVTSTAGISDSKRIYFQKSQIKGSNDMEFARVELEAVQSEVSRVADSNVLELSDLQLALVGGGVGEVILN